LLESLAGVEDLLKNPELVKRIYHPTYSTELVTQAFKNGCKRMGILESSVKGKGILIYDSELERNEELSLKKKQLTPDRYPLNRHLMRYTLLPGSTLILKWDKKRKFFSGMKKEPPLYSNSVLFYSPINLEGILLNNVRISKINERVKILKKDRRQHSNLIIPIISPYVIVGGKIKLKTKSETKIYFNSGARLDYQKKASEWERLNLQRRGHSVYVDLGIERFLDVPQFCYFIKIKIPEGGFFLGDLEIQTDLQSAPKLLPYLKRGRNTMNVYSLKNQFLKFQRTTRQEEGITTTTVVSEDLRIDFVYKPNRNHSPRLVRTNQKQEQDIKLSWAFQDPDGDKINRYHLQVSLRKDFLIPLATNFDREIEETKIRIERGWLIPGQTYYWRVKARDSNGNWSPYSETQKFKVPEKK